MPAPSFFKSPAFLTGSGFVGSGAIGIGGGQIYEENFPPMYKTMSMKGFELKHFAYPNDTKADNVRVAGKTWGCVDRLFKGVSFQHNDPDTSSSETISYTPDLPNLTLRKEDNPIGCAIMELRPLKEGDNGDKNYFYFRSEFVIKGENVGWVLLVVMASSTKTESASGGKLDAYFLHRLIFLKKEKSDWKIKEGYGGTGTINTNDLAKEKAYIKSPKETGFDGRTMEDTSSFLERKGSGIGEVGVNPGDSILKGVEAYINSSDKAEVLGANGNFSPSLGYKHMSALYKDGTGGVKPKDIFNHEKRLPKGYAPFKDLKGGWSELDSRCQAASSSRHSHVSEDLKAICGEKKSSE